MKILSATVIVLALAAVSSTAFADEPTTLAATAPAPAPTSAAPTAAPGQAPAASATPEAPAATPLATRPTKPLTLAPASPSTPLGYKLLGGVGVAIAAGLWLRKKRKASPSVKPRSCIDVVGRTSVGVRSELLVVDVEGTRLLVGMTPSAIQTLAVLETPEGDGALAESDHEPHVPGEMIRQALASRALAPEPLVELRSRVSSLFDAPQGEKPARSGTRSMTEPKRARRAPLAKSNRVAGQAKGLLLALEEPKVESDT